MIHGVMDPQPGSFGFAVYDDAKELINTVCPMHGRDAAMLPEFVAKELQTINLSLADVKRWTVGSGPGSFTFLRVVAALAAGWKYGNEEVKFRCVPGAGAVAAASGIAPGEKAGVLYDGRNKEILYFEVINRDGSFESTGTTAVLNSEQAKEFFAAHQLAKFCCFECEADAIRKIVPETVEVCACTPDLSALASNRQIPFNDDLNDLVYIRPAVF